MFWPGRGAPQAKQIMIDECWLMIANWCLTSVTDIHSYWIIWPWSFTVLFIKRANSEVVNDWEKKKKKTTPQTDKSTNKTKKDKQPHQTKKDRQTTNKQIKANQNNRIMSGGFLSKLFPVSRWQINKHRHNRRRRRWRLVWTLDTSRRY